MTKSKRKPAEPPTTQTEEPTADDVYATHGETVDELADERDDEIGAIMRALRQSGGDEGDEDGSN